MKTRISGQLLVLLVTPTLLIAQSSDTLRTPPPEATQFDYLVGDWTFTGVWKLPNGERQGVGTWKARKALDGFGVVDEWRVLDRPGGSTVILGTTYRIYNRAKSHWDMRFLNVFNAKWDEQYAEWRDGEMHLWWTSEDQRGTFQVRVRYYDISENSFRWRADRSYDGGVTWIENWLTMEVTRVTNRQ